MSFSATDAAFEGFRLVRRNPMALVAWTLLYLVVSLANVAAMSSMGPAVADLAQLMEGYESAPPETFDAMVPIFEAYGRLIGGMAWLMPISILVSVILTAAVARGVLEPKSNAMFGYIRLGMDEVRVFVVTLVIMILTAVISMAAFLAAGVIGGFAVAAIEGWGWLIGILAFLAAFCLVIWLAVRWSLAVPITVAEKKFAFFDSFRVTKGKFWPLLGMAILAGVMVLLVMLLSMIVTAPLNVMSGLSMMGEVEDPAAMFAAYSFSNPWVIATAVVNSIIYALVVGVIYAPFSAAYRALSGKSEAA